MDANDGETVVSPLENVLISLGGCSSVDVVTILKKSKQNLRHCRVDTESKRLETVPKLFSDIHLTFTITGENIKETVVERAIALSVNKYCSLALMLIKSVNITHSYRIIST